MGNIKQFSVKVKDKKDINKALRKWKRKFDEYDIRKELRDRKEFVKPSLVKRKQKNDTIRNNKREELKRKENE